MKKLTNTTIALLLTITLFAQNGLWIGGAPGMLFEKSVEKKKGIEPASFAFSMPFTYRHSHWMIESTPTYAGAIIWTLNAGFSIPLAEKLSLDLLSGVEFSTLKFNQTARLQWKDIYLSANKIDKSYLFSIGFRGKN